MKKYITTLLLIITIFAGTMSNVGLPTNQANAKAATVKEMKLSKPNVTIAKQTGNKVNINFNKVKGATEYKIYRADSKNGTYKYIGTTKNTVFTDKVKGNKNFSYKVVACKNGKELSSFSNPITVSKTNKPVAAKPVQTKPEVKKPVATKPSKPEATTPSKPEATTPVPTTKPTAEPVKTQSNQNFADEVLKLVNQERAKAGLGALTTNSSLQNAANKRAQEIVASFSHTRPDGRSFSTVLAEYNVSYRASGENIAAGQRTPSEVMNGWMNSPGHRANILGNQFGKVGIGVHKGNDGKYYWTQVFTN